MQAAFNKLSHPSSMQRIIVFLILTLSVLNSNAQDRILFILDASNSMNARWENTTRWDVARETLSGLLDSLEKTDDRPEVALRVYGHQRNFPPQYCDDTKLEVAFHANSYRHMRNKIKGLRAKGTTPIAYSLEQAANDFPEDANGRNVIILLTDGKEECDGDPCKSSRMLQERGIAIRPYIIGMGMEESDIASLDCVGRYVNAKSPEALSAELHLAVRYALLPTSAQVDLLDQQGVPSESNVAVTISEQYSGKPAYHFVHTLNRMNRPDTIMIDPGPVYKVTAHTLPPVSREHVQINPGKHSHLGLNVPQGELSLRIRPDGAYDDLRAIVRKKGEQKQVYNQSVPGTQRYIADTYELEITTLPPIRSEVVVKAGERADVQIPGPGTVTFQANAAFYGHILMHREDDWESIYTFSPGNTRHVLAMQPGEYRIVYRPVAAKSIQFNREIRFSVNTGGSTLVKIP